MTREHPPTPIQKSLPSHEFSSEARCTPWTHPQLLLLLLLAVYWRREGRGGSRPRDHQGNPTCDLRGTTLPLQYFNNFSYPPPPPPNPLPRTTTCRRRRCSPHHYPPSTPH